MFRLNLSTTARALDSDTQGTCEHFTIIRKASKKKVENIQECGSDGCIQLVSSIVVLGYTHEDTSLHE